MPDLAIPGRGPAPGAARACRSQLPVSRGARKSDSGERATVFAVGHAGSWQLENSHGAGPGPPGRRLRF